MNTISFILPVFNCNKEFGNGLPLFIDFLNRNGYLYEIIVVDDNSFDSPYFKNLSAKYNCVYERNIKNSGKGFSVKKGVQIAKGDVIIFMDGDFPFSFDVITTVISVFENKKNDVVIGDRTLAESSYPKNLSFGRGLGSKVLSFVCRNYFTPGFSDTQCGIKAFRTNEAKNIFSQVRENRFSFDVEVLFLAIRKKLVITSVPVKVLEQPASTVNIFKDGINSIFSLFNICINYFTGKYKL